jgi:pSer/pThr/pTyr-binding forkhead associated (FHA) protein
MGRIVQIGIFGGAIGLAVGVPSRSWKQAILGLTGGVIAGAFCGAVFNPISDALGPLTQQLKGGNEIGIVGRGITSVILGGAIGLFISLAKAAARTAWLRLNLGKNEGREWVIDGAQTFIGRHEGAHVPLFGDPNIAPMHACIVRQGDQYWLMDGGTPMGTRLNGQPVQSAPLFHKAQVGVGSYVLEFLMRPGSAPARAAERLMHSGAPVQPIQQTQGAPVVGHSVTPALTAILGPLAGQRFELRAPLEIGREAAGIGLASDASASRRHARLEPMGTGWQVVDLGSTNGTLVNGAKVTSAMLRPGDVLTIGSSQFRFEA